MKSIKLIVLAFALFTLNVSATTLNPIKPTDQLRAEIVDILGYGFVGDFEQDQYGAEVIFTVNSDQELIVLSVDSPNEDAERYFQKKLNYKKVSHQPNKPGEIYLLPIKLVK